MVRNYRDLLQERKQAKNLQQIVLELHDKIVTSNRLATSKSLSYIRPSLPEVVIHCTDKHRGEAAGSK